MAEPKVLPINDGAILSIAARSDIMAQLPSLKAAMDGVKTAKAAKPGCKPCAGATQSEQAQKIEAVKLAIHRLGGKHKELLKRLLRVDRVSFTFRKDNRKFKITF